MTKKTDTLPAPVPAEFDVTNVPAYRVMASELRLDGERWCKWLTLCPLDHDGECLMVGDVVNVLKVGE